MSNRPRILIVGVRGQVGVELRRSFAGFGEITACDRDTADLSVAAEVRALVRDAAPDIILNAAAYTAVDRAESEREATWAMNEHAPATLASEAQRLGALLVHYSTDYVFDGSKAGPWIETDAPCPLNVYGASKLAGEKAIREVGGRYLIFRTSWVYGPHGHNFFLTMLRLGAERESLRIVADQIGAPTTSIEIARATKTAVEKALSGRLGKDADWVGLYHMTCSGSVSWAGFAKAIFARAGKLLRGNVPTVHEIDSDEYPTAAQRPLNSVLSNEKFANRFGFRLAPWESALDQAMRELGERREAETE